MNASQIIYYGGSFNPPHIAHLLFAVALRAYFPNAEILIAPTYCHAFQKALMAYDLRIAMLHAMFRDIQGVTISTLERDLHESTSYTIDVVRALRAQYPEREILIAVGADIVPTLPQWKDYDELKKIAKFLIFPRVGYDCREAVNIPCLPEVSSSEIREYLERGELERVQKLVPAAVFDLLVASRGCQN